MRDRGCVIKPRSQVALGNALVSEAPLRDGGPATAGLNNTEAFHLSIRHALPLLPALLAKGMDERPGTDYPDRFSID
jgi:hypothetical protein